MWSVRNSTLMQGNLSLLNIISAHKVTIHIIQYLIGIDVTMVVWRGYSLRMIVIQTRTERANHKTGSFKSLMHRWWLMHSTGNRFKIVNRKSIGIIVSVPTYYIKRMRSINIIV